jgi:protein-S-isoprenylcysteine O-methyltransferase Ste14
MAGWALGLFLLYLALAFGLRTAVQLRRTGASGFKGISGRPGSAEWLAGVLFVVALLCGFAAPLLALVARLEPLARLDGAVGHAAGGLVFAAGLLTTLRSQFAMGEAWRSGVDHNERTRLVTAGPFAGVRNPIFSGMVTASAGLVLLVPNAVALVGLGLLVIAVELQVRLVEEPYLRRVHGRSYAAYAARAGRFLPGLGRLPEG